MATQPFRASDLLDADKQSLHIFNALSDVQQCVNRLMRDGFTVLSVYLGDRRPRVVIQNCKRCEGLEGGTAMRISSARGRKEIMVAEVEGCQVQWTIQ